MCSAEALPISVSQPPRVLRPTGVTELDPTFAHVHARRVLPSGEVSESGEGPTWQTDRVAISTIGHTAPEYLPRSATFIYTALRFQRAFRPVVFAQRTTNLSEFAIETVYELTPAEGAARRVSAPVRAFASGYSSVYEHRIGQHARREGCAALHAHFGWLGAASIAAAARLGIPVVTTFYGRDVSEPERGRPGRRPYRRLFAEGALFVCEGPAMARHLSEIGCANERIRIVRIGLDLSRFPFTPPVRPRPLVVVQACRFWEKKGVDLSLRAFAAARESIGPSELWLIGDGPLRPELESLATRLGVAANLRFLGMISHTEYQDVIRRAHVCIQPSLTARDGDTEGGAPTVLLEMQSAGIPIATTRHADIPFVVPDPNELVEEGDAGGLADALVRLAGTTEDEWRTRARRGRAFVQERHEARAIAKQIEEIYTEAIRSHGA